MRRTIEYETDKGMQLLGIKQLADVEVIDLDEHEVFLTAACPEQCNQGTLKRYYMDDEIVVACSCCSVENEYRISFKLDRCDKLMSQEPFKSAIGAYLKDFADELEPFIVLNPEHWGFPMTAEEKNTFLEADEATWD
jgi:hypothetical protein